MRNPAALLALALLFACFVYAQERSAPAATARPAAKPAPRLPDGHPDLGNGKGVWSPRIVDDISGNGGGEKDATTRAAQMKMTDERIDVPFQPWAREVYNQREATLSKEDPEGYCLPPGIPRMMNTPFPMQIYQLPDRILQVYEGGAHMWRIIYLDGREHPKQALLNPSYLGHSVGHWEGDTLVVDVAGFNDRTWLDAAGHPHTEKLHVIERYTRVDENTLHYQATIDDPGAYTKPWTVGWKVSWEPGWDPLEYVCQENNRDVGVNGHMVGLRPGEKHP
ncbi:MAG: hypothetical protein C5B51_12630 [Terriglobia bacterium]|nr:MAG: hypothetical protein C5B51_12630 [Terriglobia bacterium]